MTEHLVGIVQYVLLWGASLHRPGWKGWLLGNYSNQVGFRPIPLGVFRGKRKKREEKKDIMRELCKFMENYLNLFAFVSAI